MYRDIVDGEKLNEILVNLPEEFKHVKLEIFIREYIDENSKIEEILQIIKKKVLHASYLGKQKEVIFFDEDELQKDFRRPLLVKLKELGYTTDLKEGARGTVIVTVAWKNA